MQKRGIDHRAAELRVPHGFERRTCQTSNFELDHDSRSAFARLQYLLQGRNALALSRVERFQLGKR